MLADDRAGEWAWLAGFVQRGSCWRTDPR